VRRNDNLAIKPTLSRRAPIQMNSQTQQTQTKVDEVDTSSRRHFDDSSSAADDYRQICESQSNTRKISPALISRLTMASDACLIALSGFLVFFLYLDLDQPNAANYPSTIALGSLAIVFLLRAANMYRFPNICNPAERWKVLVRCVVTAFVALVVLSFAFKVSEMFSRVWLSVWFSLSCLSVVASRFSIANLISQLANRGHIAQNIILYGSGEHAERLVEHFERDQNRKYHLNVVGIFDDRAERRDGGEDHQKHIGNLEDLQSWVRRYRVDNIVITLPESASQRILSIRNQLQRLPVTVGLAPPRIGYDLASHRTIRIAGLPMLEVLRRPISDWDLVRKRTLDAAGSSVMLIALAPIMLAIAAGVKLTSKGPVFFKQQRHGFNNKLIGVYKFRTMYTDQEDQHAETLATKDDPRITPIGRFLRRWSLDELPQLFNVINGSMSLVGPRPHATMAKAATTLYTELLDDYTSRHRVKPGITGLAQVRGWRGETDTEEKLIKRVESDLEYIESWSLWLDISILFATLRSVIEGENAH